MDMMSLSYEKKVLSTMPKTEYTIGRGRYGQHPFGWIDHFPVNNLIFSILSNCNYIPNFIKIHILFNLNDYIFGIKFVETLKL